MCFWAKARSRAPSKTSLNAQGHNHTHTHIYIYNVSTYPKLWKSSRMVIGCLTIIVHILLLVMLRLMGIFTGIIYHSRFHCFIQNFPLVRFTKLKAQFSTGTISMNFSFFVVVWFLYTGIFHTLHVKNFFFSSLNVVLFNLMCKSTKKKRFRWIY